MFLLMNVCCSDFWGDFFFHLMHIVIFLQNFLKLYFCTQQILNIMKANDKILSDADPNFYMK